MYLRNLFIIGGFDIRLGSSDYTEIMLEHEEIEKFFMRHRILNLIGLILRAILLSLQYQRTDI